MWIYGKIIPLYVWKNGGKQMTEKIIKGLALGAIFGVLGYIIFKDISTAFVCGLIMFMSMFVGKKNN